MPFKIEFSNPSNATPQAVSGLGLLTPDQEYHITDAEAERFERVTGVALDKVETIKVSKIKQNAYDETKSPKSKLHPVVEENTSTESTDSQATEGDN